MVRGKGNDLVTRHGLHHHSLVFDGYGLVFQSLEIDPGYPAEILLAQAQRRAQGFTRHGALQSYSLVHGCLRRSVVDDAGDMLFPEGDHAVPGYVTMADDR